MSFLKDRVRGPKERELIAYMEQRGYFTLADHMAVRVGHKNGLTAETTAEIILTALRRGKDPVTAMVYNVRSMKQAEARTTGYTYTHATTPADAFYDERARRVKYEWSHTVDEWVRKQRESQARQKKEEENLKAMGFHFPTDV